MGTRKWLAIVVGSAVLAAGCGGSGTESASGPDDAIESATAPAGQDSTGPATGSTDATTDAGGQDPQAPTTDVGTTDSTDTTGSTVTTAPGGDDTEAPPAEPVIDPADLLTPVAPGDEGDDVVALQERLRELGVGPGSADGDYGKRTEAAVSIFQELVDLPATGEANAATMRALATYTYDGLTLAAGDEGPAVEELQRRLADGPFDPGPIDGQFGPSTVQAVWALEKVAGVPVDDNWGPADELAWKRLMDGDVGKPEMDHDVRWVEVDLSQQLAKIYDPGEDTPTLIIHISSGSGVAWSNEGHSGSSITPKGDFEITRRINGWRESSLDIGRLYNPLYFNGGIAFHGALSVPLYPASHGCIRVPMRIAEYLPDELPNGTPVHVLA